MKRFHEYFPQHRETVNRGRSVLCCCKYGQKSTLIFKPSPFTFDVWYSTIPPCVTERRGPEHSVAITLQAAQVCTANPSLRHLAVPHKSFTGVQPLFWEVCQSFQRAEVMEIHLIDSPRQ